MSSTDEWVHPEADILNALIGAGFTIDFVREHEALPWRPHPPWCRGQTACSGCLQGMCACRWRCRSVRRASVERRRCRTHAPGYPRCSRSPNTVNSPSMRSLPGASYSTSQPG